MTGSNNQNFDIKNLFNVKGYVVVVTGGGTGIGLMCAQAFANNGAKVYIVGRRVEALDQAVKVHGKDLCNGGQIIPIQGDVAKREGAIKLVEEIGKREKYVNVLINNAGIATSSRLDTDKTQSDAKTLSQELLKYEQSEWNQIFDTNVTGYYYTTAAFLPLLAAATGALQGHSGSVINISSISGTTNLSQGQVAYNVSKAAVKQLTSVLASELAKPNIKVRVNTISPGIFPSEMTTGGSGEDQKSFISAEGYREKKGIPAGRPGKDDDIAQAVLLLAVDTYINGEDVHVDGGFLLAHP